MTFWKKLLIAVIVVMTAGAIAFYTPLKTAYRQHKEKRNIAAAEQFFASGDYRNAALAAQQVRALNPSNIQACRILADIADLSQSPTTLDWMRQLVEINPTVENKLRLAEAGMRYQPPPFPFTAQILQELDASATNKAFFHFVIGEHALLQRQFDLAEKRFAEAVRMEPSNRLYRINHAMSGLSSTNRGILENARETLRLFITDSNYATAALRALTSERITRNEFEEALTNSLCLLQQPQAGISDRLQHLSILKKMDSRDFLPKLHEIQKNEATNAPAVVRVALWMQSNGLATDGALWLTSLPKPLKTQPSVLLATAITLESIQDWEGLRQLCARGNWDEFNFLRMAFLSRAWMQLGEITIGLGNWNSAVDAAGSQLGKLIGLLELTQRWKMGEERENIFWLMLQKFPRERWISAALEQHCHANGNTAGLRRIFQTVSAAYPENPGIQNNLAYTSLLLRTNMAAAASVAAKLYSNNPGDPVIASTHALALHLNGKSGNALAVMKKLDGKTLETPATALLYGILLQSAGNTSEAGKFLEIARKNPTLLPEEKALLK